MKDIKNLQIDKHKYLGINNNNTKKVLIELTEESIEVLKELEIYDISSFINKTIQDYKKEDLEDVVKRMIYETFGNFINNSGSVIQSNIVEHKIEQPIQKEVIEEKKDNKIENEIKTEEKSDSDQVNKEELKSIVGGWLFADEDEEE